jgi:non-specific serine/threonine protein kinase/serine/threonine-protein kinase
MSNAAAHCPPADTIAAFAFGELPPERAAAVQSHISQCDACLETVGHLASSKSTLSAADATRSADSRPGAGNPQLAAPSQIIGPYRLARKLGEGGMGEVWEADQVAPVRRTVALKLLKTGMDTRQIVARFEAERQVLALMQHPGIAQMFDAGITPGGRSYLVMEYVDGARITEYCDSAGLGVTDRLLLFQQVCDAVQHAHQKGAIHRDIKPSNVMVTMQDGRALPKVIDFGLAKLTSQDLNDATLTEVGTMMGTPAYASPEQLSLGVIDVDTRSDVYSLGVLLYELLVGVIPFEADGPAALLELRKSIRDLEPMRPSARLSRLGERASNLARMRGTNTGALRRQLRGELDWIVMKALEKDRSRRYATPGDLARDTQRYLEHEPVLAGSPTATYRLGKFVRRHRLVTAFGGVVLSLIIAFAIVSAVQVKRIGTERDRATAEAAKASSINTFLQETLGAADPWQTGADVSVRATLAGAANKIDTSFKDQPLVAAGVRRTIGITYIGLGRYDDAEPLLRAALTARLSLLGREHPDVAESMSDLAELEQKRGHYDKAATQYREVLALRRKLSRNDNARVADTLLSLASDLYVKGDLDEALKAAEESLAIRQRLFGAQSLEAAVVLSQMNGILDVQGDFARAVEVGRQGYEITSRLAGSEDVRTAWAASNLAVTYNRKGEPEKSEPLLRVAVQVLTRQAGENNPETLIAKENLGAALLRLKRYDETIALTQDVLARRKAALGENDRRTVRTMANIATTLRRAGRLDESERAYAEAVPRFIAAYGPNHSDTATILFSYGRLRMLRQEYAEAERLFRQALAIQIGQFKDDHPDIADTRAALGNVLTERGQFGEAEALLVRALEVMKKVYGPDASDTIEASAALDRLHDRMKKAKAGA